VFGRGGEEVLALAQAGIPCEVIPGVSSALAAPALAGIPVTHRGLASGFTVLSGHAEEAYRPILAALAPESVTVVVLMGLGHRRAIARLLLDRGWRPETPAAVLLAASTPAEERWTGTVAELAEPPYSTKLPASGATAEAPGILVIGAVVSVAQEAQAALQRLPIAVGHG
jgi:uroporphyrin-III C-methyltransferase/precorrin-2 dehydrogenase/sirohydrochlorin ferrochelatase